MDAGSVTSPATSSTEPGSSGLARSGSRTSARTRSPRPASERATALPTFPVAPVTSTCTARGLRADAMIQRVQQAPPPLRPKPHDGISDRTARLLGWAGFLTALVGPLIVWREPLRMVATDFAWDLDYLIMG